MNQLLRGNLDAVLDKIGADMVQIAKTLNENGSSNIKNASSERFQLQMSGFHQSMYVHLKGWSLQFKTCTGRI